MRLQANRPAEAPARKEGVRGPSADQPSAGELVAHRPGPIPPLPGFLRCVIASVCHGPLPGLLGGMRPARPPGPRGGAVGPAGIAAPTPGRWARGARGIGPVGGIPIWAGRLPALSLSCAYPLARRICAASSSPLRPQARVDSTRQGLQAGWTAGSFGGSVPRISRAPSPGGRPR